MRHLLLLAVLGESCARGRCGEGTVDAGRSCEALLDCGEGTVLRGELCVAEEAPWLRLPYNEGNSFVVIQGFHGYYSHYLDDSYAVDWDMPEGTAVLAARAGVVLDTKEDSDRGCPSEDCADDANYVLLDHGDGSFALYLHLEQGGVDVERGERIGQGQPLGRSGNTGFSTGPHLHLQVNDLYGQSLPLRFEELASSGGAIYPGAEVSSENLPQDPPSGLGFSTCGEHTFAFMGVTVQPGVPCAKVAPGEVSPLRGQVHLDGAQLMVAAWSDVEEDWVYTCHPTEDDGSFAVEHTWDPALFEEQSWLMLAAADARCFSYQSWATSVAVAVWE